MQYVFFFDSTSCSGCKACQVACKDRHQLPVGLLWRRVYEISGGHWQAEGPAWNQDIFAYNLSIACNHCERPICQEVCPTKAITKREDGIVILVSSLCIGCKYCSWACPYSAPQYNEEAGHMTKCDFCVENIDAGLPPACVAACPLRALDFGQHEDYELQEYSSHIYPLPDPDLTIPSLRIIPHTSAGRANPATARLANEEEVHPA